MTDRPLIDEVREALIDGSLAWHRSRWHGGPLLDCTAPSCCDGRALLARLDGMTIVPAGEVERLREALERCIDALDTVSAVLAGVLDAEVISAESILRHAAKEARAALGEEAGRADD